jgi:hypothetical protein
VEGKAERMRLGASPRMAPSGFKERVAGARQEPIGVVIHMCVVAMLGISLYSYLSLKLTKMLCLIISYVFSSTKLKRAEQVLPGREGG